MTPRERAEKIVMNCVWDEDAADAIVAAIVEAVAKEREASENLLGRCLGLLTEWPEGDPLEAAAEALYKAIRARSSSPAGGEAVAGNPPDARQKDTGPTPRAAAPKAGDEAATMTRPKKAIAAMRALSRSHGDWVERAMNEILAYILYLEKAVDARKEG